MTDPAFVWIDTPRALREACARWRDLPALALDTEFLRERSFYPVLGLIQVHDGERAYLVDPLAPDMLDPLLALLADTRIEKTLHACSEDLEAFHHRLGVMPAPVFDTQLAAAFAGIGLSPSYQALVAELHGEEVPKGQTRTNWLKRPLSEAQLTYAALDVAHLLPMRAILTERLAEGPKLAWLREECEELCDPARFTTDPGDAYKRIKGAHRLPPRNWTALKALAAWREREAKRRDLARRFVLPDNALLALARRLPKTRKELQNADELSPDAVRRHGKALLDALAPVQRLKDSACDMPPRPSRRAADHKKRVEMARGVVAEVAARHDIPPELLANRKTVESWLIDYEKTGVWPPALPGWRGEILREPLAALA